MATKGVYFNGKLLTIPGLYATVDSAMNSSKATSDAKVVAMIGECTGGEPGTVQFFSDPSIAKKVLKSGELLTAMNKAWNPVSKTKTGVTLGGADIIGVIRANKATKGTTGVKQATAKAAAIGAVVATTNPNTTGKVTATGEYTGNENITICVEITSEGTQAMADTKFNWKYAPNDDFESVSDLQAAASVDLVSGIKVAFGDGNYTIGDTFLIPVTAAVTVVDSVFEVQSKDWGVDANKIQHRLAAGTNPDTKKFVVYDSKNDVYETFDNLGPVFTIKYTGEQTYATMSIISDGVGNSIKLQTYIGAEADSAIVDLDIDLDMSTFRTVKSFLSYMAGYENYEVIAVKGYNTALSVHDFDFCEKSDIKTSAVTVTALLPDLKKTVAEKSNLVEIAVINRELPNVNEYPFTTLLGGSEGRVPTSWEEYLTMLGRYNVSYVVPLTDDESIIAECIAHVNNMSNNFGKERRLICGSGNHLTVDQAIETAQLFAGDRVQYVYPGLYDLNEYGETELYPAYILAAQHAGRAAALPDGESATHDTYRMAGIEYELDPTDITRLLNAGVVTFEFVIAEDVFSSSSVRLVQDITTYTESNEALYVERAVGAIADGLNNRIRNAIDELITGKKTTTGILTSVKNAVISVLQQSMREPYECILAYKDVKVYKEDGVTYIEYAVAPTEPNNFTLITGHFYSEEIDVSADNTLE